MNLNVYPVGGITVQRTFSKTDLNGVLASERGPLIPPSKKKKNPNFLV